ncbi:MAG: hypothetical protein II979_06925, partial [Clostridia bacterium]|nr:hypothetical protein [Clostridia bacterium]
LFVINVSEGPAEAVVHLYPDEYAVSCPYAYSVSLEPMSVKIDLYIFVFWNAVERKGHICEKSH